MYNEPRSKCYGCGKYEYRDDLYDYEGNMYCDGCMLEITGDAPKVNKVEEANYQNEQYRKTGGKY